MLGEPPEGPHWASPLGEGQGGGRRRTCACGIWVVQYRGGWRASKAGEWVEGAVACQGRGWGWVDGLGQGSGQGLGAAHLQAPPAEFLCNERQCGRGFVRFTQVG